MSKSTALQPTLQGLTTLHVRWTPRLEMAYRRTNLPDWGHLRSPQVLWGTAHSLRVTGVTTAKAKNIKRICCLERCYEQSSFVLPPIIRKCNRLIHCV
jgi:hypothetical protein